MKSSQKREMMLSIYGILLLIIVVIGTSYAVFSYSEKGKVENTISTGAITFTYNEATNGISLTNAQPMTDNAGKILQKSDDGSGVVQGYFDFSVSANMSNGVPIAYEVYGTVESGSTMDPKYIKVYLTDGATTEKPLDGYTGSVVPVYDGLTQAISDTKGKQLYTSSFSKSTSQQFRLRLWISSDYANAATSQTFIMRVNVATIDQ